MTLQEINELRNERGIFSASNEAAGWYAISRDGKNMITFLIKDESKFYTERGFATRITQLQNKGW